MSLKKIELQHNVDLKKYTHIKIGGKAKYFFWATCSDDLVRIFSDAESFPYVLGAGSNLLISDSILKKPVVKLSWSFNFIKRQGAFLEVGSSTPLPLLIKYCIENDLGGLQNLVGIPATIGGLLAMGASSFGASISSHLQEVEVMDKKGEIKTLPKDKIDFGYRFSSLCDYIILSAKFKLQQAVNLKVEVRSYLAQRFSKQDFSFPSCGCIFKNPEGASAGYLIDSCGLKGQTKGDAQVSGKHANFIINLGSAKYDDVDYLIQKIKDQIYKKYSIILDEEIKRWQ